MSESGGTTTDTIQQAYDRFQTREKGGRPDDGEKTVGGLTSTVIRDVPLSQIDLADQRFQSRIKVSTGDLRKSIEKDGQQVPVVLWGNQPPYVVIDGFRRILCAQGAGWSHVKAIIRDDISEDEAFNLSFIENVKRKNYSRLDRAHAAWRAIYKRGLAKESVAKAFGISVRQVERYLEVVDYPPEIQDALLNGHIAMTHAALLSRMRGIDLRAEIEKIASQQRSLSQLKSAVRPSTRAGRPMKYWKKVEGGFQLFSFKFDDSTSPAEKEKIRKVLQQALDLLD